MDVSAHANGCQHFFSPFDGENKQQVYGCTWFRRTKKATVPQGNRHHFDVNPHTTSGRWTSTEYAPSVPRRRSSRGKTPGGKSSTDARLTFRSNARRMPPHHRMVRKCASIILARSAPPPPTTTASTSSSDSADDDDGGRAVVPRSPSSRFILRMSSAIPKTSITSGIGSLNLWCIDSAYSNGLVLCQSSRNRASGYASINANTISMLARDLQARWRGVCNL